jgi:hypothetical protein
MKSKVEKFNLKTIIVRLIALAGVVVGLSAEADTWHWYNNVRPSGNFGYSANAPENWENADTGAHGVPTSGDYVVASYAAFGSDFTDQLAFGGVTITADTTEYFVDQGSLTLQAGGPGLVVQDNVASLGAANGSILFVGSGEAVVDIQSAACVLTVIKSLYGNAGITLVKKGAGTLGANDYYFFSGEGREKHDGYYRNRKFSFGAMKLQGGTFRPTQYYTVSNLDFQFDGDGTTLDLYGQKYYGHAPYSWRLKDCRFRETANVRAGTHKVTAAASPGVLECVGDWEDTVFSGEFAGFAGLLWNPDSQVEFVFSNKLSSTAGNMVVSNGTIRIACGAGFSSGVTVAVDGSGSRFQVDASANAHMSKASLVLSNGGVVSLAGGVRLEVAAVAVDGEAVEPGLYHGSSGVPLFGSAEVLWIDGAGYVCVGSAADPVPVPAEWTGNGVDRYCDTPGNWSSGSKPDLSNGGALVTVVGGAGFVAQSDVWVNGFDLSSVAPFAFGAMPGKNFWIGSGGILFGPGTYCVEAPLVISAKQAWRLDPQTTLEMREPLDWLANGELYVVGTASVFKAVASLGGSGFVANIDYKTQVDVAAGVTNNADIRVYNDQTDTSAADYYFGNGSLAKPVRFLGGAPTVMNGMLHNTNNNYVVAFEPDSDVTFNGDVMGRNSTYLTVGSGARVRFNGRLLNRNQFNASFAATGVFEMNAEANCFGYANPWNGWFNNGTIRLLKPFALMDATVPAGTFEYRGVPQGEQPTGRFEIAGSATLDLCGNEQSLRCLSARGGTITSATDAMLTLNANDNWTTMLGVTSRVDLATWSGGAGLVYNGGSADWPRFMMKESSTTGRIEVVAGRLVFPAASGAPLALNIGSEPESTYPRPSANAGWPNCSEVTVKGGVLELEHSTAFGKMVDVRFEKTNGGYGKIRLASGVSQKVNSLVVDGVRMPSGTYGAVGSGAPCPSALFEGTGVLCVGKLGLAILIR